ncbi:MAG: DUF4258 domain-containing protein [Deferribacteres bacterium]|nr:DUF4258 domain-containing protein [candidate division KSB1 bacterium]MCB9509406.1 DUF4258 domain-containing protein [Deferribacteres bacterium]
MPISDIHACILQKQYRISEHAIKRMIGRAIERIEAVEAILNGEIIEEYPDDKYSPSCFIYGKTNAGRDLHIQVSLPPRVIIITTYDPDPGKWIDCRVRRS